MSCAFSTRTIEPLAAMQSEVIPEECFVKGRPMTSNSCAGQPVPTVHIYLDVFLNSLAPVNCPSIVYLAKDDFALFSICLVRAIPLKHTSRGGTPL